MLDRLLNAIAHKLGSYAAAVDAQRKLIEAERASDNARDHAGREFVNPEGFTTPLPKAAQNAQNAYARARRDFEKANPLKALEAAVALILARERRDETAAALKAHLAAEDLRKDEGVHPEVKPFFADMFELGVEPRRLPYVRFETLAIICDMIKWDGHDRDMQDPDSPMPAIFSIYAGRQMLTPGQFYDRERSKPGAPVAKVRYTDPEYIMFGELLPEVSEPASPAMSEDAEPADETYSDTSLDRWSDLPRQFAGFKLVDVALDDDRFIMPPTVFPLPPSTDIADFTANRIAPPTCSTRRETYRTWIGIIEAWAAGKKLDLHHQQPAVWAMILGYRLKDDDSDVSFFQDKVIESPWQRGSFVAIEVIEDDIPERFQ